MPVSIVLRSPLTVAEGQGKAALPPMERMKPALDLPLQRLINVWSAFSGVVGQTIAWIEKLDKSVECPVIRNDGI